MEWAWKVDGGKDGRKGKVYHGNTMLLKDESKKEIFIIYRQVY